MIRLPRHSSEFPRPQAHQTPANAWGSQWKHLPRGPMKLVRTAMGDGLRTLRG
jgi:hypothetical protein